MATRDGESTGAVKDLENIHESTSTPGKDPATRVFDTVELLHMILANLPTQDLINVFSVNRQLRHAADTGLEPQRTLFQLPRKSLLTPPGHRWRRRWIGKRPGDELFSVELQPDFDVDGRPNRGQLFRAIELCPLLAGAGHRATFSMRPTQFPSLAKTSLSNPPSRAVQVFLRYVLEANPGVSLGVDLCVNQASPLTMGKLLQSAHQRMGWVTYCEPSTGLFYTNRRETRSPTCLQIELAKEEEKHGGRFRLDLERSTVHFYESDIVSPEVFGELQRYQRATFTLPPLHMR